MLSPKNPKHKKCHRGRLKGKTTTDKAKVSGEYALVALESAWLSAKQIEAARLAIKHCIKRTGNLRVNIFPDKPITARAKESRMGSGKGAVSYWAAVVKVGTVLFELSGTSLSVAFDAFQSATHKLPIKTKTILA